MVRRLFCWSGGGMPGLDIHAGLWLALEEAGITSSSNAGTSAGALMAALNSFGYTGRDAEGFIRDLSDADVRRERFLWKLRIPWIDGFLEHGPIETILGELLPDHFHQLDKPLSAFVTDEASGIATEFRSGPLVPTLLASMSISGVFSPVMLSGRWFSDGGTTQNLPLPKGWCDYDEVYLLCARRPTAYVGRRAGMLSRLMYNVDLLMTDQMTDTIHLAMAQHRRVRVLAPPIETPRGSLHFDHDLIGQAREWCAHELAKGAW